MTVAEFRIICEKVKPYTNYLYLHVMGEPLLHPDFAEIMRVAQEFGFNVNITTNGSLLQKQEQILLTYPPRQINISLHDLEENLPKEDLPQYIEYFVQFADKISKTTYLNLRLWNRIDASLSDFNKKCLSNLAQYLGIDTIVFTEENLRKGIHLKKHIYLQNANRFEWPNIDKPQSDSPKTCYALKDHIAILSDGSIVPCCIDADAHLLLGNIYTDDLRQVVHTKKALLIKEGFARKEAIEHFCKVCGFR